MLALKTFTFSPVQENTYILYNEKREACIIDPGCYFPNERKELAAAIENERLKPVMLLNTHCHLDHIFGNKYVCETWNLQPHLHKLETPVLAYAPTSAQIWQLPFEMYEGDLVYIKENEEIMLGGERLLILHTPGHSPGSVSFYHEEGGFIIGGDVLFRRSVGRTDIPGGDFDTLLNSIHTQFFVLPDNTVVYPGHGESTIVGYEKKNNPFLTN
jgi:hydroxyacylglutathione hydrolase